MPEHHWNPGQPLHPYKDRSGGIATVQGGPALVCLVKFTLQLVVFLNILFLRLIIEFS